jgi:parallel beta-helix repeat protein
VRKASTLIIAITILISVSFIYSYAEAKVTVDNVTVTTDKGEYTLGSEAVAKAQLDYTGSKKDLLGVNFTWYYPNASVAKVDLDIIPDGAGAAYSSFWPDMVGSAYTVKAVYSGDETKFHQVPFDVIPAPPSNHISGSIGTDTIWTVLGGPYIVIGDVFVELGITLTIEPGVVVEFKNGTLLMVNGTLNAQGNETNMITFTSNETHPQSGDWEGIDFNNAHSGSKISFSRIEYANKGINIHESSPEISHNLIRDIEGSGIEAFRSSSYIHNNTITKIVFGFASNKGINLQSECNVIIENNVISDVEEYGIKVLGSDPLIRGNYISGSIYDIECTDSNATIVDNLLFDAVNAIRIVSSQDIHVGSNRITGCSGYGIRSEWSSPSIFDNVIHENMGTGIWLYKNNDAEVSGNLIKHNEYGIDVQQGHHLSVENNVLKNNTKSGLQAEGAEDLNLVDNDLMGNENGIYLKDTVNISLSKNMGMENQEKGLFLYNCPNTLMESGNYSENTVGLYLHQSTLVMSNTTLNENSERDLFLSSSSNMISINSTFSSDGILISSDSDLIVKNYLHLLVQNETYEPFANAEFVIFDNGAFSYSHHTDENGYFGFIQITERAYSGSIIPTDNTTLVDITEDPLVFENNPREVDMSFSHTEIFAPGNPLSISIDTPSNQTLVYDNVNITGTVETHGQENVTVKISIDGGEWIYANLTGDNWSLWWVEFDTSILSDGEHVINAKISSQYFEKEEVILIDVDNQGNKPPVLSVSSHIQEDLVSGVVVINGTAFDHDGELESVSVKIDSGEWIVANNLGGDWRNWSFSLDSKEYPNGTHKITIMAIDNSSERTFMELDLVFENENVKIPDDDDFSFLPLLAVILPLLLCVLMFLIIKRKKDRELRERYSEEEDNEENGSS